MTCRTQVIDQFYDLYAYISLIVKTILLPKQNIIYSFQAIRITLKNIKPQSNDNQWEPETTEFIKKFLMDVKSFRIVPFSKVGDTYNVVMFTIYDRINVADLLVQKRLATYINSR